MGACGLTCIVLYMWYGGGVCDPGLFGGVSLGGVGVTPQLTGVTPQLIGAHITVW